MSNTKENIIAIGDLQGVHFLVEKYQRGYKWGLQQVYELLTDIYDFERGGIESFYCLQPVVVKTISENTFELIDGQQRLTTIFLILRCLNEDIYTLSYKTRDSSEVFLKDITNLDLVIDLDLEEDINKIITPKLQNSWISFTKKVSEEIDNVDNFHFYCAYQFIKNWLNTIVDKNQYFKKNLLEFTKVIWYEQTNNYTAENVFIKFNQGKIELAQAELIKALFVLQFNTEKNIELRSFKLNQFAEEWNFIENQLQDDSFWFFVSNDVSDDKKSNRIDLLFDLITEKPITSNDKLFSYHHYLKKYTEYKKNKIQKQLNWPKVNELFNQIFEWYHDRQFYHLIGFIIYEEIKSISEIHSLYHKVESKHKFQEQLKIVIRDYLSAGKSRKKFDSDALTYGENNREIETILVLHNVINYHFTDHYYRFPFDRLKLENGWSLEHIHAQNTDRFEGLEDIKKWIEDIEKLAENFKENDEINLTSLNELLERICAIRQKLENENVTKENGELKGLVKELEEKVTSFFNKDSLSNLCLLDRKTNSSIGNKFFNEKREEILNIDKMSLEEYNNKYRKSEKIKPFIPIATKHVFLKYFTDEGNVQMTFWGVHDREDYQDHIKTGIQKFLKIENSQ
ncbi:DUF262 domain-containing protein [Belliella sp. DSM 107340]|uniref:DUF262 domain-containing protein n=1 Tax=Belliella calami TaxID=2923436 RepID=A0ABS9UU93_9BACT|nr:DUF262 domain-containing protein [Belliella calami]MCH7400069.1 DUF262 domain-containing protein [Belliella calami]